MTASLNYPLIFVAITWVTFLYFTFQTRIPFFSIITGFLTLAIGVFLYAILPPLALLNFIISFIFVLMGICLIAYSFFR